VLKPFGDSCAIGIGAATLDFLLPEVVLGPLRLREALIRAAYLMYRAKKDHSYLKGSDTDVLVINEADGDIRQVTRLEMKVAEDVGPDIDFILRHCYLGLLGISPEQFSNESKEFLSNMNNKLSEVRRRADELSFPSLQGMKGI
jgi:hypothetical protein